MEFTLEDPLEAWRPEARRWADEHVDPTWADEQQTSGTRHTPKLHELLAAEGWLGAGWPLEYGGTTNDVGMAQAIVEELAQRGIKMEGWGSTNLIASVILEIGTEEQKQSYVAGALRGTMLFVLGYTEPDCGSDAAAVKTKAVIDGSEWIINGQKMFTSSADRGTHVFLLTRTNPEVPKHRGLTMFLVPLDIEGVSIEPIYTLGGQRTNSTYYADIRVPDACRIGEVDGGWTVMRVALVHERKSGAAGSSFAGPVIEQVARWAQSKLRDDGTTIFSDATVQQRLVHAAINAEVAKLLRMRSTWIKDLGGSPDVEGAAAKLFTTETAQRAQQDLLDIIGPVAVLTHDAPDAALGGLVEKEFRAGVVTTIYAGTSEIVREIVAQRGLGLPRTRN